MGPLYRNKCFAQFYPLVGMYSIVVGGLSLLLKILRKPNYLEAPLREEDCFLVPKSHEQSKKPVALVTGANTGIGYETALSLVERGYEVVLGCRSRDKGELAANSINERVTKSTSEPSLCGTAIFIHPLDLSSLNSVRMFAEAFVQKYSNLNVLVNNAGINSTGKSADGLDLCFQTNFVGHYLLTRILLPLLTEAKNITRSPSSGHIGEESGRIVNLSSVTHHFAHADEERRYESELTSKSNSANVHSSGAKGIHDAKWWKGCAIPGISSNTYKESKFAAVLFTNELNIRFGRDGVRAVAVNPGAVNSDIWRTSPKFSMENIVRHLYLTSKQGSSTSIAGAVGNLPIGAVYLQPYWLPQPNAVLVTARHESSFFRWYKCPFPVFEAMGPYIGHAVTDPRLPDDSDTSSVALWDVCEDLVGYNTLRPAL